MIKIRNIILTTLSLGLALLLSGCDKLVLLNPKGMIAADEKNLMITSVLLMLIVVVPVILLSFIFAWRYREGNKKATYSPNWSHSNLIEVICWSVPCVIIVILGVLTWSSSHRLDPYKPLAMEGKPVTIQAIALEWKWLFIYPEQNIATINFIQFPVNTPVRFYITAEGPMNSFQIPQLGGQIYAMAGMQTKLNLIADAEGDYRGISANFSGDGFSDMKFTARVSSQEQFDQWVKTVKQSPDQLSVAVYNQLIQRSENNVVKYFSSANKDIFETAVMKAMMPITMSNKDIANICNTKSKSPIKTN